MGTESSKNWMTATSNLFLCSETESYDYHKIDILFVSTDKNSLSSEYLLYYIKMLYLHTDFTVDSFCKHFLEGANSPR